MSRVAVVGATGYAGAELIRILAHHPQTELTIITSRQHAGVRFDQVYPSMTGHVELVCETYSVARVCDAADIVFMALPHQLPMEYVPDLIQHGKKVIDLSADFRFNDASLYEAAYQPHTSREVLPSTVYGLSEIYKSEVKTANLVGNPGCYPTSVLLPLVPLIKEGILDTNSLIADSKSGVSGAGRSLSITSHYCQVNESIKPYKVAQHRHNPEMEMVLTREAGHVVNITFVPHLVPMTRGMLTTIYAVPSASLTAQRIEDVYQSAYSDQPFIRMCREGHPPDTLHVRGTNYCDIGFRFDARSNRLILMSAIDNLVKGAAGQAVQNMNIMLDYEETAGLIGVPFPL